MASGRERFTLVALCAGIAHGEFSMKSQHLPHHWIAVVVVLALMLFTLSNLYGQRSDGAATFRGRPALAGAQAGVGAQAGLPQGGLGQQGTQGSERTIATWPARSDNSAQAETSRANVEPPPDFAAPPDTGMTPRDKDSGMANPDSSAATKAKRAADTADRSRHGVSPIDSTSPASN